MRNHTRAFDWCQNQRPWMTLEVTVHAVSKHMLRGVVTYSYSFTFYLLLCNEWLQRMFNVTCGTWSKYCRVVVCRKNTLHHAVSLRYHVVDLVSYPTQMQSRNTKKQIKMPETKNNPHKRSRNNHGRRFAIMTSSSAF